MYRKVGFLGFPFSYCHHCGSCCLSNSSTLGIAVGMSHQLFKVLLWFGCVWLCILRFGLICLPKLWVCRLLILFVLVFISTSFAARWFFVTVGYPAPFASSVAGQRLVLDLATQNYVRMIKKIVM